MRRYKELLRLYKHPFTLIRLGRNSDGGYVVPKELISENLITCGISNEISFEEDYIKNISASNIHAYDGTISSFPSNNKQFNFHKLNIGTKDTNREISLNSIIENNYKEGKIFLKMDIEGSEYQSFGSISKSNLERFSCIVIEVHRLDKEYDKFEKLLNLLEEHFVLIHKHDNNNGRYFSYEGKLIPNVYELTFVNKCYIKDKVESDQKIHIEGLDFVNNTHVETKFPDL